MSLRSSSRLWRLAAAMTPFPVVALGYFAAAPGSHLAFQLEVLLSGAGAEYARSALSRADTGHVPLGPEALKIFAYRGKGPRLDLFSEIELAQQNRSLQPVAATFGPVGDLTGSLGQGQAPFAMASGRKGDRHPLPVTDVFRNAGHPVKDMTAAMFLVSPVGVSGDAYVADASDLLQRAAWKPSKEDFMVYEGETEAEFQERERRCLATAIYFEARGEPVEGQKAVAQVVMNRVRSPLYPDTICGVVYQGQMRSTGCQFSFTCDGKTDTAKDITRWELAQSIAREVTSGKVWLDEIGHASHYHATYVRPKWVRHMNKIKQVGRHIFYRLKKEDPYIVEEIANEAADQGDDGEITAPKSGEQIAEGADDENRNVAQNGQPADELQPQQSASNSSNFFSFSNVSLSNLFGGNSSDSPSLGYSQ